jgi:signal transduction histidine kinase
MGVTRRRPGRARGAGPSRKAQGAVVLGGVVAGAALTGLALTAPGLTQPGYQAALACWVTLTYVLAGLIAWRRRPESRLGVLMITAGFGSCINFLIWSSGDVLFTIGLLGQFLPPVLFLHVFLAFPDGRLSYAVDRAVVAAAYAAAALSLPQLLVGFEAGRNVLAVTARPALAQRLQELQLASLGLLLLVGVGLLVHHRGGARLRPAIGLLVDAFLLALVMTSVLMLAGLFGWTIAQPVRIATFLALGLAPIVFLAGLLQARLDRAAVADLLLHLGASPPPTELQHAVRRALHDSSATLAFWLPEFECYGDAAGREVDVAVAPGRASAAIVREDRDVAVLLHDPGVDANLVTSVVAAAGVMIENAQLQVELRARLVELQGSRARILEAEQRARMDLERDLHDGAQQRLVALSLELATLDQDLSRYPDLRDRLGSAQAEVRASLAELRDVAHGIFPAAVRDHGLSVALESLATRAAVPVRVVATTGGRLPEPVELTAFYLVSESLTNIGKHACASHALVELARGDHTLVVEVTDDGVGGAATEKGTGLRGLADRVEALGGRLRIWSPDGGGTRVRAEIPCAP